MTNGSEIQLIPSYYFPYFFPNTILIAVLSNYFVKIDLLTDAK